MKPIETRVRTLVRSLTWRVIGVLLTVLLTWLLAHDIRLGVELGLIYNGIRLGLHYVHDRFWARVGWGTPASPESDPFGLPWQEPVE